MWSDPRTRSPPQTFLSLVDVLPVILALDLPLRGDLDGAAADAGSRTTIRERATFTTLPKVVRSVVDGNTSATDEGSDGGVGDLCDVILVPEEGDVSFFWDREHLQVTNVSFKLGVRVDGMVRCEVLGVVVSTGRAAPSAQAEVNWVLVDVESLVRGEGIVEVRDGATNPETSSLSLLEGDKAEDTSLGDGVLFDNAVGI